MIESKNPNAFPFMGIEDSEDGIMVQRGEIKRDEITKFVPNNGMTLRDYFAAKALVNNPFKKYVNNVDMIAEHCYKIADAMLEARSK